MTGPHNPPSAPPLAEPLVFEPVYQERIWGGRILESFFGRNLPRASVPYGESWEITAREDATSIVRGNGPLAGRSLGDLWTHERGRIFGARFGTPTPGVKPDRFPLLVKILDARDRLSIQVHPPASIAESLGGEPKTEMWYIAHADPGAKLYVGLRQGVTRADFEAAVTAGETDACVHHLTVESGQFIFIPSGRLHAIGAGLVIYEIQQNSDTTFRVFDWNRCGLDGKPRALHVAESLQCIDFEDQEPQMGVAEGELLVECPDFRVENWSLEPGATRRGNPPGEFAIITVIEGKIACGETTFGPGDFFLVPADGAERAQLLANSSGDRPANILRTTCGKG